MNFKGILLEIMNEITLHFPNDGENQRPSFKAFLEKIKVIILRAGMSGLFITSESPLASQVFMPEPVYVLLPIGKLKNLDEQSREHAPKECLERD